MSEIKTNKISPRKGTTQTIGDSGDTISIPCGVTTTNAGTISTAGITGGTIDNQGTITGLAGVIEWDTTAKTTAFTAVSNKGYFCNTTSAAFTVTFPASPTAGDVIALKDYANTFDTNNLTIDANGNKIQGSTTNFDITVEGANSQFIYVDATRGWVLTDASKASDIAQVALFTTATGGTITTCGDYKIHTFTSPGTFCVSQIGNEPTNPAGGPSDVDYMVVAGGGGASLIAAGGAGGFRESSGASSGCYSTSPLGNCVSALPISATAYPITVGGGGTGTNGGTSSTSGSNSVFSTITSTGGGGVENQPTAPFGVPGLRIKQGLPGGSGGGVGVFLNIVPTRSGGSGNTPPVSPPQGNNGGSGPGPSPSGGTGGGSGGGGATAAGTATSGPYVGPGRAGGAGATTSISGSSTAYAGGGGGGGRNDDQPGSGTQPGGSGGTGGGGPGGQARPTTAGTAGTVNTGGGGGGGGSSDPSQQTGGSGGSGIVIIRYKYQ